MVMGLFWAVVVIAGMWLVIMLTERNPKTQEMSDADYSDRSSKIMTRVIFGSLGIVILLAWALND